MSVASTSQALICIDMQNDFCLPGAPLQVAGAMACLPFCQTAVAAARRAGMPVFWVLREHDEQGAPPQPIRPAVFGAPARHLAHTV